MSALVRMLARTTVVRTALALVAAAAAFGFAGSATAAAAATPKYKVNLTAYQSVVSNLEEGDYPEDCANWTTARSTVAFEMESGRTFNVGLIRNPVNDSIWGQVSSDLQPTAHIYRHWRFRAHYKPDVEGCSPCGPSSEYGPCTGEVFDDRGSDDCGSTEGPVRRGFLSMMVSDRGITVIASPMADFSRCEEPRTEGLPLGPTAPKLDRFLLPSGTRELQAMKVGATRTIRRVVRRGACGRTRGKGLRVCTEINVQIRAKRVG
ncbi:hypothetical protein VSS74_22545 [Conexibacter stalactiti]|uniref:Uncharacterized protein n=1 Tax=Conexibacter stalactiti TaxID=1940611 RepID=A0ABU4HV31_9ACTN|nr:hypothetical protein [Conexibacter stalactiti]MDW5597143.1 hypothetical protein [Conexibacter stalactiti]MEC5037785.1 hypothetical protein [Conexibacter stalactiti]